MHFLAISEFPYFFLFLFFSHPTIFPTDLIFLFLLAGEIATNTTWRSRCKHRSSHLSVESPWHVACNVCVCVCVSVCECVCVCCVCVCVCCVLCVFLYPHSLLFVVLKIILSGVGFPYDEEIKNGKIFNHSNFYSRLFNKSQIHIHSHKSSTFTQVIVIFFFTFSPPSPSPPSFSSVQVQPRALGRRIHAPSRDTDHARHKRVPIRHGGLLPCLHVLVHKLHSAVSCILWCEEID